MNSRFLLFLSLLLTVCSSSSSSDDPDSRDTAPASDTSSGPGPDGPVGSDGDTRGDDGAPLPDNPLLPSPPGAACAITSEQIRITHVDVGIPVVANENEAALQHLTLSPTPGNFSRLAFMGTDGNVHVVTLDEDDALVGDRIAIPANDYGDLLATADGGVIALTRDAPGGGTLNCGNPENLCYPPTNPVPCDNMYLVGFDAQGETFATRLTEATVELPPYSTAPDGDSVVMIWWYAHHVRMASSGDDVAAYYGAAISVAEPNCINIHQGDRMDIMDLNGRRTDGGFRWGCSHSGYQRILWDSRREEYVTLCLNDRPTEGESGKLAFAPRSRTIRPLDLWYANIGDIVPDATDGYWVTFSHRQEGEPINANGNAEVYLMRFDQETILDEIRLTPGEPLNARAPHLATLGTDGLLVAYETSAATGHLSERNRERTLWIQARRLDDGSAIGDAVPLPEITGNRYQSFRSFPDGSVAYAAKGDTESRITILRVFPCTGE